MRVAYALLASVLLQATNAAPVIGQWERLITFDSSRIVGIHFDAGNCAEANGLISVLSRRGRSFDRTLRTSDWGVSWTQVQGLPGATSCFTFSDPSHGWCSPYGGDPLFVSTDSGKSWSSAGSTLIERFTHLFWNVSNGRLIATGSSGSQLFESSDQGVTWFQFPQVGCLGIAFTDGLNGIVTGTFGRNSQLTTDGGLSWQLGSLLGDEFDPLAITGTHTYFALSEWGGAWEDNFYRSDDGGSNWQAAYRFPPQDSVSGAVVGGICQLFVQTSSGVYASTDQGLSWVGIGGPISSHDLPMEIAGGYLFAINEGLLSSDASSSLWRYKLPRQFRADGPINASSCVPFDTTVTFSVSGICSQAILQAFTIVGSGAFRILNPPSLPDTIGSKGLLRVEYTPARSKPDTAYLLMSLCTPSGPIDTSIALYGSGIKSPNVVHLSTKVSPAVIHANDIVTMQVYPDQLIKNAQLNTLDLDLSYLDDLLELVSVKTAVAGASVTTGAKNVVGGRMKLPITLSGTDMTLDPSQPVLEIAFRAFLSDSSSTDLTLSNLKLNGTDPSYQCKLAADIVSPSVTLQLQCGDPTVQQFLRTKNLVLTSIHPNPANRSVSVSLSGTANSKVNVAIYDVLGKLVIERSTVLGSSELTLDVDLSKLVAGSYILRVSDDRGMASSKRLVVER